VAACWGSCVSRTTAESSVKSHGGKAHLVFGIELCSLAIWGIVVGVVDSISQAIVVMHIFLL